MRRLSLIGLVLFALAVSAAAVRLSGHATAQLVPGPLAAGGEVSRVPSGGSAQGDSLPSTGRATVPLVRINGPVARSSFAQAAHPQFPHEREAAARKLPRFVAKTIRPAVAYRARSEGTPAVNAR